VIDLAVANSPAVPHAASGCGALAVRRIRGRSVVVRAYAASPLKLLTPINHGHAAWAFTSSHGGGLVDGDRIALDVDVGDGAAAYLSTQAATKVYRSPHGTQAVLRARVGHDGVLVVAPDPVVCFAGSRYRQDQEFALDDPAAFVLVDWLSSGRRAYGERWAFDEYASRIVVRLNEALVVHDAMALRTSDGDVAPRLGRFDVLALAVIIGGAIGDTARTLVSSVSAAPIERQAAQLVAARPLGEHGCVVRIAGPSVEPVARALREMLDFVPALLGDDPWKRKW
jgi:urease accessory protein